MDAGAAAIKNEKSLTQFLDVLDEKSRAILWHLWWYRHADIDKLRDIIDASSDYEVLYRLKDVINEKAQKLWGKPVVSFEQSKTDPLTGDKVLFNWWFLDEVDISLSGGDKPLVDIFNEKDSVTVIAELPTSVEVSQPEIDFRNGILRVKMKKVKSGKSTEIEQKKRKRRNERKGQSSKT
jgi:hypothetical protein